ncbi:hypothetical protein JOM56_010371 [Amanita muscaria]
MHPTRSHLRFGDVPNTRPSSPRSNVLPSGSASIHPQTQRRLIRFHPYIPPCAGSFSRSAHAEYEDIIAHQNSSIIEGQASLLNDPHLLPQKATYVERQANNFLDVYRRRRHVNPEPMKQPYHRQQRMIPKSSIRSSQVLPIPDNDACQSFTGLGSGEGELGASRYHMLCSVSMDTLRPTGVETLMYTPAREPVQHQPWALSHIAQTSMLRNERENISWKGSDYEKRTTSFPAAYPSYLQLATSEYGCASEIGLDDSSLGLPEQPVNPAASTGIVEPGKGYAQSSIAALSKGEMNKLTVCSFIFSGIKHYRCECGFESASKGRMDRHRDSLLHSKRKHGCACGRFFTRADSLQRHKKKCNLQQH